MALFASERDAAELWIARPCPAHGDLSSPRFILGLAAASLGIGLGFAAFGAWPVIPFAGLEILALWCACHHLRRHLGDYEKLVRDDRHLFLERSCGGRIERHEFDPGWARLRVFKLPDGRDRRLLIGSHGREIEIGRRLTDMQKKTLACALKKQLGV